MKNAQIFNSVISRLFLYSPNMIFISSQRHCHALFHCSLSFLKQAQESPKNLTGFVRDSVNKKNFRINFIYIKNFNLKSI